VVSNPVAGLAHNSGPGTHETRSERDFLIIPPAEFVFEGYDSIGFRCALSDGSPALPSAFSKIGTEITVSQKRHVAKA